MLHERTTTVQGQCARLVRHCRERKRGDRQSAVGIEHSVHVQGSPDHSTTPSYCQHSSSGGVCTHANHCHGMAKHRKNARPNCLQNHCPSMKAKYTQNHSTVFISKMLYKCSHENTVTAEDPLVTRATQLTAGHAVHAFAGAAPTVQCTTAAAVLPALCCWLLPPASP